MIEAAVVKKMIRDAEKRLANVREKGYQSRADLNRLNQFASDHQRAQYAASQDLEERRMALATNSIDASRVRIMEGLTRFWSEQLDAGNAQLSKMEEQKRLIWQERERLEEAVNRYRFEEMQCEDSLRELKKLLLKVEAGG